MKRLLIPALLVALALGACKKAPAPAGAADMEKAKAAATAFMADNAKKPGVQTIEDGIQYQMIHAGPAGGASPKSDDRVKVMYEGKLTNGTVFDSSYERGAPSVFSLEGVIPGWSKALQKMHPGDEWTIWLSPDKGYGYDGDNGPIPAGSVLIFRVELQAVAPRPITE